MRTAHLLTVPLSAREWEGVSAKGGVYPSIPLGQTPPSPWTEWLTDRCKNITFPPHSFAGGNKLRLFCPCFDHSGKNVFNAPYGKRTNLTASGLVFIMVYFQIRHCITCYSLVVFVAILIWSNVYFFCPCNTYWLPYAIKS